MGTTKDDGKVVSGDPNARGGVYVRVDLVSERVVFVGRSVDVGRRLDWWRAQQGDDRYRGVVILRTDDVLFQRAAEQKALDQYGALRPDPGDVPRRGD